MARRLHPALSTPGRLVARTLTRIPSFAPRLALLLACVLGPAAQASAPCTALDDTRCLRERYEAPAPTWPAPNVDAQANWRELAPVPSQAPHPPGNPPTPARVELGRKLFFDARLSRKGEVSCATCHQPARAFSDGRTLAVGEDQLQGRRRTQTLLGSPFADRLFWDGRAGSLEEQVMHPIFNDREMNQPLADAVARLASLEDYRVPLADAFGDGRVDTTRIGQALASFIRTLRPEPTRFDRFLAGEKNALTDQELRGLHLFRTQARCLNCHSGPLMTDHGFHDLGLSFYGRRNQDLGRFEVTRDRADLGKFKTPSLRNVSRAGPWMHNGLFPDLRGLLRTYNAGMGTVSGADGDPFVPVKSPLIRRLELTPQDIDALAAFLQVL